MQTLLLKRSKLRRKKKENFAILIKKNQNWNHHCKGFQAKTTILSPSWDIKEGSWIKNINSNALNQCTEINFFSYKCIFVFWFLGIFMAFCLWIHTKWGILKLTLWFNWAFMHYWRFRHCYVLGLQGCWFRALHSRKNWDTTMAPWESEASNQFIDGVAPNFWLETS